MTKSDPTILPDRLAHVQASALKPEIDIDAYRPAIEAALVVFVQESAQDLVRRMCAVTQTPEPRS